MKALLDTNVIVSASLSLVRGRAESATLGALNALLAGHYTHITSDPLVFELGEVLQRAKFGLSGLFVIDLVEQVATASLFVPIKGLNMGCRDAKDDKVIEAAINGRIDVLVTRDEDLYDARSRYGLEKRGVQIATAAHFLEELRLSIEDLNTPLLPAIITPQQPR